MKKKIIKLTPFGPVVIIWSRFKGLTKVVRVFISKPGGLSAENQASRLFPGCQSSSCAKIDALAIAIKAFLKGGEPVFSLALLDFKQCSAFQESVLRMNYRISRGSVGTYQQIATRLGRKSATRAVGCALAKNPFPLIVPCHRIIRSDHDLGGFQGGLEMKQALLRKEGIL